MFRGLLAHPQKALYKLRFVYCVCVMSVDCTGIAVELHSTAIPVQPPEEEQVLFETFRSPYS
jgi:hypothetical protein